MMVMAVRNFYNGTSGTELKGKKLGIHAYGNVGRNVARIAKGFGMEIYAFDAFCPASAIEADGVKPVASPGRTLCYLRYRFFAYSRNCRNKELHQLRSGRQDAERGPVGQYSP